MDFRLRPHWMFAIAATTHLALTLTTSTPGQSPKTCRTGSFVAAIPMLQKLTASTGMK